MSKGAHAFKETDVARAIRAAQKTGLSVGRLKIKPGEIVIETGPPTTPEGNGADEWKAAS